MKPETGSNQSTLSTQTIQKAVGAKVDGSYGPLTTQAVKDFQTANGLLADGIVGPKTQAIITSLGGIPGKSNIVQDTTAINKTDSVTGAKIDTVASAFTGAPATGVYGTPVKDAQGNDIGTEKYDTKTGQPLKDPNATTTDNKTGTITTPDGATYNMAPPAGSDYQLPAVPTGSSYVYGADGKAYVKDEKGAITSSPAADAEWQANKDSQAELTSRLAMYDTYKAGLDPIYQTLIDGIKTKAQQQSSAQQVLNKRALGAKTVQGYRTGSSEYTPEIDTGILKAEEEAGLAKLGEIDSNLNLAIAQAVSAKVDKDFTLAKDRLDMIDNLKKAKQTTIENIYKSYSDNAKAIADQIKAQDTADKANRDQSLQELTVAAPALTIQYDSLSEADKATWLDLMTKKTGLDSNILLGALEKSRLDVQNKNSIMDKRDTPAAEKTLKASELKKNQDNDVAEAILRFQDAIKPKDQGGKGWAGISPDEYEFYKKYIKDTYGADAVLQYDKAIKDAKLTIDYGTGV
jgi:peptidoglycan hydrolase-like protein with peptidoglycan-binding domain